MTQSFKIIFIVVFFNCFINCIQLKAQVKEIDSLKNVLSKMPDDTNKVNTLRLLFIATIDKRNANEALPIAARQLELAKKIKYLKGEALAYKLQGVAYWSMADMERAIENYLNALKVYEKLNNDIGRAACYSNMGLVYMENGDLNEALLYLNKSLAISSKMKNRPEDRWRDVTNIGIAYEKQNKDAQALNYFSESLKIDAILKKDYFWATSFFHLGSVYIKKRDYHTAEQYLLNALVRATRNGETYPLSEIYTLLGKIYIAQNQLNRALEYTKKGLETSQKANYRAEVVTNYLQVSKIYAAFKNYNQAYHYQNLYITLKDSLQNVADVQKIAKLQYNYQLEKKEAINQRLLKDQQLREAEILLQKVTIKRQYDIGAIVGIILLSLVLLSVFYYRSFQAKKRDNELLSLQQQEILQQNEEITAQNEEIYNQKEALAKINHTKDKLFSIISHDLRSPILTLQHTLALFNDHLLTSEDLTALSAELLTNVESTSVMLDNVLYWAKNQMDGEEVTHKAKAFDISEQVYLNLGNFKEPAENKKIALINKMDKEVNVMADKPTIDIVLRNLISNAIKFCGAGDSITVSQTSKDGFAYLSVADTGMGISKEVQKKLFDKFDFYSTNGTANEKGTGLGLNLCRDFVAINGGSIWVESEPGQGSTFTFTVPLA